VSIDRLINLFVTITLIEMMATVGLRVTFGELAYIAKNRALVVRALVANYLAVPIIAIALLVVFQAHPMVAAGFLVLAVCPGAPYGPPFARIAYGDVKAAVGLMAVLAGSSAFVAPLLLAVLLPRLSNDSAISVEPIALATTLLITQLLPLVAGMLLKHWYPNLATRLVGPGEFVSKLMNLFAVWLILATQYSMLMDIRLLAFVGMLALLGASLAVGWFAGERDVSSRKTMALTTSLRNAGVGLVIVTGSFPGTPAASAALAYGIVAVLGSLAVALWWRQRAPAARTSLGSEA
jgi:BASS family bile acid:Na+ symporter